MHHTGRRPPSDDKHVRKYPYRGSAPSSVENILRLPSWASTWNQRKLDACAGFATCMCLSVLNEISAAQHKDPPYTRKYDAVSLWWMARLNDEFPGNDDLSDPNQGTTVRSCLEIVRAVGPKLIVRGNAQEPDPAQGISEYRWGHSIDHIRASIAANVPVILGIDAWLGLAHPVKIANEPWVGDGVPGWTRSFYLGPHTVAAVGASDHRQGVLFQNSWNMEAVWMKYDAIDKEIKSGRAEIGLITDRPGP